MSEGKKASLVPEAVEGAERAEIAPAETACAAKGVVTEGAEIVVVETAAVTEADEEFNE